MRHAGSAVNCVVESECPRADTGRSHTPTPSQACLTESLRRINCAGRLATERTEMRATDTTRPVGEFHAPSGKALAMGTDRFARVATGILVACAVLMTGVVIRRELFGTPLSRPPSSRPPVRVSD